MVGKLELGEAAPGRLANHGVDGRITRQTSEGGRGLGVAGGDHKVDHRDLNERGRFASESGHDPGAHGRTIDVGVKRFEGGEAHVDARVEGEGVEECGEGAIVAVVFVEGGEHTAETVGGGLGEEPARDEFIHGFDASTEGGEFLLSGGIGPRDDGGSRRWHEAHAGDHAANEQGDGEGELECGPTRKDRGEETVDAATGEGEWAGGDVLQGRFFEERVEVSAESRRGLGLGEFIEGEESLLKVGPLALASETGFEVRPHGEIFVGGKRAGLVVDKGVLSAMAVHEE